MFSVFPNPANTEVYQILASQKARSAEVCNPHKQLVRGSSELAKAEYIRFDVSAFQSIMYYIEIVSSKGKQVKRFARE